MPGLCLKVPEESILAFLLLFNYNWCTWKNCQVMHILTQVLVSLKSSQPLSETVNDMQQEYGEIQIY